MNEMTLFRKGTRKYIFTGIMRQIYHRVPPFLGCGCRAAAGVGFVFCDPTANYDDSFTKYFPAKKKMGRITLFQ